MVLGGEPPDEFWAPLFGEFGRCEFGSHETKLALKPLPLTRWGFSFGIKTEPLSRRPFIMATFDFQIFIKSIFEPDSEPKVFEYSGTLAGAKQKAGKAATSRNTIQLYVGTDLVAKRNAAGNWRVTNIGKTLLKA
jgi:hypothetical protein